MSGHTPRRALALVFLCALGLLGALVLSVDWSSGTERGDGSVTVVTQARGFEQCRAEDSPCLVQAAASIANEGPARAVSMWQSYALSNPQARLYCHSVYHVIGRVEGKRTRNVWESIVQGEDGCNNGYNHGVVEGYTEKLSLGELAGKIATLCEPESGVNPGVDVGRVRGNCVHGVGHALVEKGNGDWREPVEVCGREFRDPADRVTCSEGAWMGWSDRISLKGGSGGIEDCLGAPEFARNGCLAYAPRIEWTKQRGDGEKVMRQCDQGSDAVWKQTCALGLGRLVSVLLPDDAGAVFRVCRSVEALSAACVGGYAQSALGLIEQGAMRQATLDTLTNGATAAEREAIAKAHSQHVRTD